jgi:subtilase family serine protease
VNFGPFNGPGNGKGANSAATSVYYTPAQVRHAYGFDQLSATGSGQTIAIVDAYGSSSIQKDLNTFCSQFNITPTTVATYYPQGTPSANAGWAEETSLDVEWAHAIAPGAKIVLVVAKSASYADLLGAVDYAVNTAHATVVSMSWGGSESSAETGNGYDSHFNHPGVTFVASAGDSSEGVEWPAASPYVVGVGGTSLYLNSDNSYNSEVAWSGSGGGISQYESAPPWQSAWSGLGYRCVPDVSYLGDPNTGVLVVYQNNLYVFGGTSVGAPQWAALVALSQASLNSADAALYSAASVTGTANTINPSYFHDIQSGNNGADPDDYAIAGYDLVTGLGSPVANGLVPALTGVSPSPNFALSVLPSSQTVTAGSSTSYTVTVTSSGGYSGTVGLSVAGLPTGATGTFSSSSVSGGSGSSTLSIQTTSTTSAGTYNLTITGTDTTGTSVSPTHSVSATLVVKGLHGKH